MQENDLVIQVLLVAQIILFSFMGLTFIVLMIAYLSDQVKAYRSENSDDPLMNY